ncbi:MAG: sigma-70 family RNA polymerase sigma factor [Clostridiales bacterium]|nr:sigma-70 family RNA polymerase sigma factor [Clostridiales bacterium]
MNKKEKMICEKIYEDNHRRISWYIWKHHSWLGEEDIYDVMQDLWKSLCQEITQVSKRTEQGQWAWLITVTNNRIVSKIREKVRNKRLEEKLLAYMENFSEPESIENAAVDKILAENVLEKMTDEEKYLLFGKFLDRKPLDGEEALTTLDNATVCKTYRARKKLEKHMREEELDE